MREWAALDVSPALPAVSREQLWHIRGRADLHRCFELGRDVAAPDVRWGREDHGGHERQRLELPQPRRLYSYLPTGARWF